jgi:hypothetical protein
VPVTPTADMDPSVAANFDPVAIELYKLSTLIYLIRGSQDPWQATANLTTLVDRAFNLPNHGPSCTHLFPLFIIGCEADTDERRVHVLEFINATTGRTHARNMRWFRAGIQSIWAQRDLHSDSDLMVKYLSMVSTIISSYDTLPSYV